MNATATLLVLAVACFASGILGQNIDGIINCVKQFGFPIGIANAIKNNPMMIPEMNSSQLCFGKCWLEVMNLTSGSSFNPANAINSLPIMNMMHSEARKKRGMNMTMDKSKFLSFLNGCNEDGTGDCMMFASIARCVTSLIKPSMTMLFMNPMVSG